MYSEEDSLTHYKGLQMELFGFHRKRLDPRVLPWQQYRRCHSDSFVMYISGEEHFSNISGDILDCIFNCLSGAIYDIITFLTCIEQKSEYL